MEPSQHYPNLSQHAAGRPDTKCFPQTLSLIRTSFHVTSSRLMAEIHHSRLTWLTSSHSSPNSKFQRKGPHGVPKVVR